MKLDKLTSVLLAGREEASLGRGAEELTWMLFSMPFFDVVHCAARMVLGRSAMVVQRVLGLIAASRR